MTRHLSSDRPRMLTMACPADTCAVQHEPVEVPHTYDHGRWTPISDPPICAECGAWLSYVEP